MDSNALRTQGKILMGVSLGWFVWPIPGHVNLVETALRQLSHAPTVIDRQPHWRQHWSLTIGVAGMMTGLSCLALSHHHQPQTRNEE